MLGLVCHRYLGKETKFWLMRIIIFRSDYNFSAKGVKKNLTGVGLVLISYWSWFFFADCNEDSLESFEEGFVKRIYYRGGGLCKEYWIQA